MSGDKPAISRKTTWAFALSFVLALPQIIPEMLPFIPPSFHARLTALAALIAGLAAIFARMGASDITQRLADQIPNVTGPQDPPAGEGVSA